MKTNKTILNLILSLFLGTLVVILICILNREKESPFPPKLSSRDIQIIESHVKFEFPESTKIIKAYWDIRNSSWLNLFFEFDKKDVKRFMKSVYWNEAIDKQKRDIAWYKVEDPKRAESLIDPVFKEEHRPIFGSDHGYHEDEELEWWKPNKEKIRWILEVSDAKLRDANVVVERVDIFLEESDKSYRVYFQMSWTGLQGSNSYLQEIRNIFPFDSHWEKRMTESQPYPKLKKE